MYGWAEVIVLRRVSAKVAIRVILLAIDGDLLVSCTIKGLIVKFLVTRAA